MEISKQQEERAKTKATAKLKEQKANYRASSQRSMEL